MSTIASFTHLTPDQRAVTIRSATLDDATACVAYMDAIMGTTEYLADSPGEFTYTVDQEREWIRQRLDNPGMVAIVAVRDNVIIGVLDFRRPARKKMQHAGSFGISLLPGWRGQGLGTVMINALLNWARDNPLIDVVSLCVFATNTRAIALYERLGFKDFGLNPRCIKLADGTFVDERIMAVFVS